MSTHSRDRKGRIWHVSLWVGQVLLAALFGFAGFFKTFTPISELAQGMPWVASAPFLIRFIGISELAGALGLVLPAATRIRPWLTPLAAAALVLVMVLAAGFHLLRGEFASLPVNFVVGAIAALIAWGRVRHAPILERRPV